jgi:hypothetical protein
VSSTLKLYIHLCAQACKLHLVLKRVNSVTLPDPERKAVCQDTKRKQKVRGEGREEYEN